MKVRWLSVFLAALALIRTSGVPAHHSISVMDISQAVWVKGKVLRYRPGAPHALVELAAAGPDGRPVHWIMEGPFPGRMARIIALYGGSADTYLKPGDAIEVCGFRPKAGYDVRRSYSDATIDSARFIHAELLWMPDGQMRAWGPYGKLDNCIRARDSVDAWREFLNRDVLAHELWCAGLKYIQAPSLAPKSFVQDVNAGLSRPCQ
jgi:Family of unknown function (DUF6152)